MSGVPPTRRRWFQFGAARKRRARSDIQATLSSVDADEQDTSTAEGRLTHAIEDVLVGVAIIALAFDERIPKQLVRDVVARLMDARCVGREEELIAAARQEVDALPDWECEQCQEPNPGTFEMCWSCGRLQPSGWKLTSVESKIVLGIESTRILRSERASETTLAVDPESDDAH
jgi:hypothetical protein